MDFCLDLVLKFCVWTTHHWFFSALLFLRTGTWQLTKGHVQLNTSSFHAPGQRLNFDMNTCHSIRVTELAWNSSSTSTLCLSPRALHCGGSASPPHRVRLAPSETDLAVVSGGCHWHVVVVVVAKDAEKHRIRHRTAPRNKESPSPKCQPSQGWEPLEVLRALVTWEGSLNPACASATYTCRLLCCHSFFFFCNFMIISHWFRHFKEALCLHITRHLC